MFAVSCLWLCAVKLRWPALQAGQRTKLAQAQPSVLKPRTLWPPWGAPNPQPPNPGQSCSGRLPGGPRCSFQVIINLSHTNCQGTGYGWHEGCGYWKQYGGCGIEVPRSTHSVWQRPLWCPGQGDPVCWCEYCRLAGSTGKCISQHAIVPHISNCICRCDAVIRCTRYT